MRLTHGHALPCFCILRDTALLCVFVHSVTLCYAAFLVYSVTLHSDAFLHSPRHFVSPCLCTLRDTAFRCVPAYSAIPRSNAFPHASQYRVPPCFCTLRDTAFRRVSALSAILRSDVLPHAPRYRIPMCLRTLRGAVTSVYQSHRLVHQSVREPYRPPLYLPNYPQPACHASGRDVGS